MKTGDMTLRELCDVCGVSRRAVQGYEKAGLVQPGGRNERGYLIYDPAAQDRIRLIRTDQRFGFRVKTIKDLIDSPPEAQKQWLIAQKTVLENRIEEMQAALTLLNKIIEEIR